MTATAPKVTIALEQRIILPYVSWATFEGLLVDHFERNSPRLTYDRGRLELMVTSGEHEVRNRMLALLVEIVSLELGVEFWNLGHATLQRKELEQGFEPDTGFYFHTRPHIRRTIEFDPATDRPPDLVLEIDLSSDSLSRFPIYAGSGVPEVWRNRPGLVEIWQLEFESYTQSERSRALPLLTAEVLGRFLEESLTGSQVDWVRSIQTWVRDQMSVEHRT